MLKAKPISLSRLCGNAPLTSLVVIAVLCLTAISVVYIHKSNLNTDTQRFRMLKDRLHSEIVRRVKIYCYGLMGTRGVFAASNHVDRNEFEQIFKSRDMASEFPAATGMGYIHRVWADDLAPFIAQTQQDGAPDFRMKMLADQITHDDLFLIKYVEPLEYNRAAMGLDIGQESRRRTAAEHAMRSGDIALTAKITLVQASGSGPGFLIMLPYYANDLPTDTPQQREAALKGWVYMPLLATRLFAETDESIHGELIFRVLDNDDTSDDPLLYDSQPSADSANAYFQGTIAIIFGGRHWLVEVTSTSEFKHTSPIGIWMASVGGLLLAFLLALLLQILASSLKRAQDIATSMTEDLRQAAFTDRLTGLPNRGAIIENIQNAIHRSQRVKDYHYAVLFLDFDRFKLINDSLGHEAGDQLLQEISRRLKSTLRANDAIGCDPNGTAARLGGDEFIVLLDGIAHPSDATIVAQRLLDILAQRYQLGNREIGSTVSIGVVNGSPNHQSADDVIRDADTAMYEAKDAGRGVYMAFDTAMRSRAIERLNIENDLSQALGKNQFFLLYQPIVSLTDGRIESFEALVRWQHPEYGLISPDRFIPIAEETGMIVALGQWVLDHALTQLAQWRTDHHVPESCSVSVNLSRKQLVLPDLCDQVPEALHQHGVPAKCLHLEVTENEIMQDPAIATSNLQKLRRYGIRTAIDDFGTGHSSLACLHEFPVDTLKIDRAFVASLEQDKALVTVLRTVVELAQNLNIQVVAEGIETPAQLDLLRALRCEYGQGYLFSKPLPAAQVPPFCAADNAATLPVAA